MSEPPDQTEALLKALISLTGRVAFPSAKLRRVVGTGKQLQAYNLCDGTRLVSAIRKAVKVDQGNFSRTVTRWERSGVLFALGTGKNKRPLHIYPLGSKDDGDEEEG